MTSAKQVSEHFLRVREFMSKAGQVVRVRDEPTIPVDGKERIRIVKLIVEEALELSRALGVSILSKASVPGYEFHQVCNGLPEGYDRTKSETELRFVATGSGNCDLVEAADALADLSVVTMGGFNALGIADLALLELIDESNLSKFKPPKCPECDSPMVVEVAGQSGYLDREDGLNRLEDGTKRWVCSTLYHFDHPQGFPIESGPHRRDDGKLIKPPYWKKPNIASLLERQKGGSFTSADAGKVAWSEGSPLVLDKTFSIEKLDWTKPPQKASPTQSLMFEITGFLSTGQPASLSGELNSETLCLFPSTPEEDKQEEVAPNPDS